MYRGKTVLLVGYGVLGSEMLRELEAAGATVGGVLDDFHEGPIGTVELLGPIEALPEVIENGTWDLVIVGASLIPATKLNWIAKHTRRSNLPLYVLPERSFFGSLVDAHPDVHQMVRTPRIEDLFARSSLKVDIEKIGGAVAGRRVLVTGAGGSIGSEISRQLIRHEAAEVGLLDRDDCLLHDLVVEIAGQMHDRRLPLLHVDVQNLSQVMRVVENFRPDVVIHTAALKHVTTLEAEPANAVAINILGTANVLEAARACGVEEFVNVSTDKAASRSGVLGLSKYIGERLTQGLGDRQYRSVRFGNVIGSRGSVLHTFRIQASKHEYVLVRGEDTSRFFMTLGEAASLVLSTVAQDGPAGTYVFDMGSPVQIIELAQAVIDDLVSDSTIRLEPLHAGEAEQERLFHPREQPEATDLEGIWRVTPLPLDVDAVRTLFHDLGDLHGLAPDETRRQLEILVDLP